MSFDILVLVLQLLKRLPGQHATDSPQKKIWRRLLLRRQATQQWWTQVGFQPLRTETLCWYRSKADAMSRWELFSLSLHLSIVVTASYSSQRVKSISGWENTPTSWKGDDHHHRCIMSSSSDDTDQLLSADISFSNMRLHCLHVHWWNIQPPTL